MIIEENGWIFFLEENIGGRIRYFIYGGKWP